MACGRPGWPAWRLWPGREPFWGAEGRVPDQGPVRHAQLVHLPLMSTGTRPWGPSSLDTGLGQLCRVREGRDAEGSLMGQTKAASWAKRSLPRAWRPGGLTPTLTPALGGEGAPGLLPLGLASPSSASYQHQGPWRRDPGPRAEPPAGVPESWPSLATCDRYAEWPSSPPEPS